MESKVFINNKKGIKLAGLVTFPESKKEKYPAIILVHGFNVDKHDAKFDDLAQVLAANGFLVFRFDFAGCGESEGDFINENFTTEINDLKLIIDFVNSKQDVENVGLIGQSMGAAIVSSLNPDVKAIMLVSSSGDHHKNLPEFFGKGYNPKGISEKIRSNGRVTRLKSEFWEDFKKYNFFKIIKKVYTPVLFIHGDKDLIVSYKKIQELYSSANEPKKIVIINGMDHDWNPDSKPLFKETLKWFNRYLKGEK